MTHVCVKSWQQRAGTTPPTVPADCEQVFVDLRVGLQHEREDLAELSMREAQREEHVIAESISRSSGRVAAWFSGEQGKSPFVENSGDLGRQNGVVSNHRLNPM